MNGRSSSLDAKLLNGEGEAEPLGLDPNLSIEDYRKTGWSALKAELKLQLRLAPPLSMASLGNYMLGLITIGFVGRLGELPLSVAILATSIFNAAGLSILTGLAAAMETFCGQAYGGGSYALVGVVLQRAMLLTVVVVTLVGGVLSQMGPILKAAGQDHAIADGCGKYLQLLTPALFFMGTFEALKRYLYAQGVVRPATYVTVIALTLSPVVNYLLIYHLGGGLDGAALAVDTVQGMMAGMLTLYVMIRSYLQRHSELRTWHGFSRDALRGWGGYLKIAVPSVIMLCGKWWTYEAVVIMSGLLPKPEVSVGMIGIALYISSVVFQCISGIGMATSVRVSNCLGAGMPHTAKRAVAAGLVVTVGFEATAMAVVAYFHKELPWAMTSSSKVARATSGLLPVVALGLMGDGVNSCMQGLLRGAGKQVVGAVSNLASYWLIGIPLAWYFGLKAGHGAFGLWWAVVFVNTFQGCVMLFLASRLDYPALAIKAVTRLRSRLPAAMAVEDGQAVVEEAEPSAPLAALAGAAEEQPEAGASITTGVPMHHPAGFFVGGSETGTDLTEHMLRVEGANSMDVAASWPPPVYGSYF